MAKTKKICGLKIKVDSKLEEFRAERNRTGIEPVYYLEAKVEGKNYRLVVNDMGPALGLGVRTQGGFDGGRKERNKGRKSACSATPRT